MQNIFFSNIDKYKIHDNIIVIFECNKNQINLKLLPITKPTNVRMSTNIFFYNKQRDYFTIDKPFFSL